MAKFGVTKAYRFYADRFYLDRANRDTYLYRQAAADVGLSGNLYLANTKTVDGVDVSVHAADLDAHTKNVWEIIRTGEYISFYGRGGTTKALTAANLYSRIFLVVRDMTVDRIGLEITTQAAAGKKARLGIYANGTNLYPGTLTVDGGEVAIDAAALVAATISQSLTKGIYHVVVLADANITVKASWDYHSFFPLGLDSTTFASSNQYWVKAQTYGALPATFPSGGTLTTSDAPILPLRVASLD